MTTPRRPSSHQRGLGWKHQQQRARLLTMHTDGTPCWWCARPMYRDHTRNWDYDPDSRDPGNGRLAADHEHARVNGGQLANRLLHATCNKQRGKGDRDHLRPAIQPTKPDGRNALDW